MDEQFLVNNGVNIYKRNIVDQYVLELPLCSAILAGNVELTNNILQIYESDLQFIERALKCENKFWLNNPILIGYGDMECSTLNKLYSEYQTVEIDQCANKEKCVVILLKSDNLTSVNVLCLSPTSEQGRMITLRMLQAVYPNETLDINAKNGKNISLLCATAASGMFDMSVRLLRLGAEVDILELAGFSMQYGQLVYLDNLYKQFSFQMYGIFISNEYFNNIFGRDDWPIFEYVVKAIMMEKQLNWRQIVNYIRIIHDPWNGNEHNTVFHHAVNNHHCDIARNILQYSDCQTTTSRCTYLPNNELSFSAKSRHLLMTILEIDPSVLEIMEEHDEEKYAFGVIHQILSGSNLEQVDRMFTTYPAVKYLFFKIDQVSLKYISELLSEEKYDIITYVLKNSTEIQPSLLYEILERAVERSYANVELFKYITSRDDFNLTNLPESARRHLFSYAVSYKNYEIFQILLQAIECDLDQIRVWSNRNLLSCALQKNADSNKIFKILLQKSVNFKHICDEGKNLLHYSVAANNFFTTKMLLEFQVDMDKYDMGGKLPIHFATSYEIFELLNTWTLKSYVNVKTKHDKLSPLHLCMSLPTGDATNQLVRYILDSGGNVGARNNKMRIPLTLAADTSRAKLLLERYPDFNGNNSQVNYLINHFFTEKHDHDILDLISEEKTLLQHLKCPEKIGKNLLFAIRRNCNKIAFELLEEPNLDVSVCDNNRHSLLHVAVLAHNFSIIDTLIEKGVSIESRNYQKETPLHIMCDHLSWFKYKDFMTLLKHNPDINSRNRSNKSPIMLAARQSEDKIDIVIELLLKGANILDCAHPNQNTAYDNLSGGVRRLFKFLV